jgi:hypothetical protein
MRVRRRVGVHAPSTRARRAEDDEPVDGYREGQKIWVEQGDGSQRAAIFVGEAEQSTWFGGGPGVYVVYPDTRSGEAVSMMRVLPREEDGAAE